MTNETHDAPSRRPDRSRLEPVVFFPLAAIAAYIAISSLTFMVQSHLPFPYWDHWGHLLPSTNLANLAGQANEHRIVVGRLVFCVDTWLFDGTGHFSLFFSAASLVATAGLVSTAATHGPRGRRNFVPVMALGLALLLSTYAWDTFLWPFQASYVGVCPLAAGAFILASRENLDNRTLALAIVLGVAAAYSLASGLLVLPLLIVIAILRRAPATQIAWMVLLSMFLFTAYFVDYERPGQHAAPADGLTAVVDILRYLSVFIGGPLTASFGEYRLQAANALGWVGLAGYAGLVAWQARQRRTLSPRAWALPATAAFAAGWGLLAALGRHTFGVEQALASRYGTPALLFWYALGAEGARAFGRGWSRMALAVPATGLAALLALEQENFKMVGLRAMNRFPEAETALLTSAFEKEVIDGIIFMPSLVTEAVPVLRRHRWSVFSEPWADWLGKPLRAHLKVVDPDSCRGYLDSVAAVPSYESPAFRAEGWAWDPDTGQRVERVVLTDGGDDIVGFALGGRSRADVPRLAPSVSAPDTGFIGHVGQLGAKRTKVRAYAILSGNRACPLRPSRLVDAREAAALVE